MKSRIAVFALLLGASSAGSCLIYDEGDLIGSGGPGAGAGGRGAGAGGRDPTSGIGGGLSGSGSGGSGNNGGQSTTAGMGAEGGEGGEGATSGTGNGGAGTGGTGGSNGGGGGGKVVRPELIDDLEDGNQFIPQVDGRNGGWYTAGDGTAGGTLVPPTKAVVATDIPSGDTGTAPNSTRAFRFQAANHTDWGASAGIDFVRPPNAATKTPYDATAYRGIRFWGKASAAGSGNIVVRLPVRGTHASGSECGSAAQGLCDDHYMKAVALTTSWKAYEFAWLDFRQEGWGHAVDPFTPDLVLQIEFLIPPGQSGDFWIDDLEFLTP